MNRRGGEAGGWRLEAGGVGGECEIRTSSRLGQNLGICDGLEERKEWGGLRVRVRGGSRDGDVGAVEWIWCGFIGFRTVGFR